jgi:hypothetical protein
VPAQTVTGNVTAYLLCRRSPGLQWQSRITVTDPASLTWITHVLSLPDEKANYIPDCTPTPPEPPVLMQTTQGTWLVTPPVTVCGAIQPHVSKMLHAYGIRAQ